MRDDPLVIALVKQARDGDRQAWNQLVERYAPLVWSICRRYRLSPADIDDAGAAVWLRLVEGLRNLREPAALPGWLATVTRRECLRVLRERHSHTPIDDDRFVDESAAEADAELLRQERFAALRRAFAELPERCRRLLALLFTDPPPPYAEISEKLELPVGGIGPTRMRCIAALRHSQAMAPFVDPGNG
ncbi:putative RNA polymerase sigma factor [Amycolatopsis camponoti]|uniref:Putative RNA polymerase sigma factor n=1 Tax=Amycolatopsis camponoti TaxID=2606593 RepID=A0A6I8MAS9_9PSEU|nr:sigma-70 family RNA polymerase sigma factor [Amycolatopsis camponoti]VVJ24858.1 putative RNA polymerase sigma factor [Amycolatopsis camponoti]